MNVAGMGAGEFAKAKDIGKIGKGSGEISGPFSFVEIFIDRILSTNSMAERSEADAP